MLELNEPVPAGDGQIGQGFLKSGVKLEPLVDRWYAWPLQLAPAQQALNLAFRYLPTVRSFIAAPGATPSFHPFFSVPRMP